MKSWLAKFRISAAMDAGEPLPKSLRRAIAADPELERFARRTGALGSALRNAPQTSADLHGGIMRAVRAGAQREQPRRAFGAGWLAAGASAAAVAGVCLWISFHHLAPASRQPLDGAVMVLEMGEKLPNTMPSLVMAPLSNEWARVDHDLQSTTQVLLASFP
ncbi:MAG TPA: hypothetical protein VGO59_12805 [Verrucomicrobiae bacterium]|jgi:hypothetical protein